MRMKRMLLLPFLGMFLLLALPAQSRQSPEIPAGFPRPQERSFAKGKKHPVFTGPGESYQRAGKGKGAVSTNDWIQVFGEENGWLLIHYGISENQMRFGYISSSALQKGTAVSELEWELTDAVISERTALTDDPLASQAQTAVLEPGTPARRLGAMGGWAYVETSTGEGLTRGFVKDSALSVILTRDESKPFDLRATSWGRLEHDYATTRYFLDPAAGRYREAGAVLPNVWLRLDSTENPAALETLSNFRVVSGRATCAPLPVPLAVSGMEGWGTARFLMKEGFWRGALEVALESGEELSHVIIACDRLVHGDSTVTAYTETLTLPLHGVPEDTGYPTGGAVFSLLRSTRFTLTAEQKLALKSDRGGFLTLGSVLEDALQPMPEAPAEALSLPYDDDTGDYSFYLLEGRIMKQPGDFGVYDVTFSLMNPPDGVYLAAYQECDSCSEIDAFDMPGGEVFLTGGLPQDDGRPLRLEETLERDFAILLLADTGGRGGAQMDQLIRGLDITASFSAEKWNISYEQHLTTSAIGPRSGEKVRMEDLLMTPAEGEERLDADGLWRYVLQDGSAVIVGVPDEPAGELVIPDRVDGIAVTGIDADSVGHGAFEMSQGLTGAVIPNSVSSIGFASFAYCENLAAVTLPDGLESIGESAFYYCFGLKDIIIPDSVTSIGYGAFMGSGLTSVAIPKGVTAVSDEAFSYCGRLSDVTFPDTLTDIGESAFYGNSSLTDLNIPDGVTSIGGSAFSRCVSMSEVIIPASVTYIGDGAFAWCSELSSVTIPASVTSIGNGAFDAPNARMYDDVTEETYFGSSKLVLIVEEGSAAERFAVENGIPWRWLSR